MIKALIATAVLTVALALPASASPEIGKEAPNFTARTADGKTVDLKSLRGKIVVLEWTNHECPYVRMHYGANNMQATQKDATGQGVVWLQIISSPPGKQGFLDGVVLTHDYFRIIEEKPLMGTVPLHSDLPMFQILET